MAGVAGALVNNIISVFKTLPFTKSGLQLTSRVADFPGSIFRGHCSTVSASWSTEAFLTSSVVFPLFNKVNVSLGRFVLDKLPKFIRSVETETAGAS